MLEERRLAYTARWAAAAITPDGTRYATAGPAGDKHIRVHLFERGRPEVQHRPRAWPLLQDSRRVLLRRRSSPQPPPGGDQGQKERQGREQDQIQVAGQRRQPDGRERRHEQGRTDASAAQRRYHCAHDPDAHQSVHCAKLPSRTTATSATRLSLPIFFESAMVTIDGPLLYFLLHRTPRRFPGESDEMACAWL